jgi:hypothetical protein
MFAPALRRARVLGAFAAASLILASACYRAPVTAPAATLVVENGFSPGTDLRDVLDHGVPAIGMPRPDALVTRDAMLIEYAARSGDYIIAPLAWSTTYVLAVAGADSASAIPDVSQREALARDAVSVDARGSTEPFGWLTDAGCAIDVPLPHGATRAVIAYAAGDDTARQLAERIAARSPAASRVAPVPADSIAFALARGDVAAAVMPLARDETMACGTRDNTPVIRGAAPLVDTRAHVIKRLSRGTP